MSDNNKRWPIKFETTIEASAEVVWQQMSAPASVHRWHPFVKTSYCESWDGVGAIDHVSYYNGATFDREIISWIDGVGYDIALSEDGRERGTASWRIVALSEKQCKLQITAYLSALDKTPLPVRWFMHQLKLKPLFRNYLELSLQGFAYHAETGEKTLRNQFGSHPIFSPGD